MQLEKSCLVEWIETLHPTKEMFFTLNATTANVIKETTTTLSCWGIVPSAKVGGFSNNSALKRL